MTPNQNSTNKSLQLEAQLEAQEKERNDSARSVRNVDRTVKDLQLQIERRDKANTQLEEDISRNRDKVEKLLKTIDELQSSESDNQLAARRAERALKEEKEKALRLEKELESWKGRAGQVGSARRAGSGMWSVVNGHARERSGSVAVGAEENGIEIPKRKSSISRAPSMSKGFL